jgi:hypothetical protein
MYQIFVVFRLKLTSKKNLGALFPANKGSILNRILQAKPGYEVRTGHYWAVGNVEPIANEGIVFKFGRKVYKADPVYDETSRDFVVGDVEEADCVDAYYHEKFQLLAIEKNSQMPEPWTLAKYLSKIINSAWKDFSVKLSPEECIAMGNLQAEYTTVRDHRDFVRLLNDAYRLKRISVSFSKPNAFCPADFRIPLENHAEQIEANRGTVTFIGDSDLNRDVAIATAKDASAAGQNVSARLLEEEHGPAKTIKMGEKEFPLTVDVEITKEKTSILEKIVNAFIPLLEK